MKRKALHELYSVMWSRAGFLFQFEKMTAFTLFSSFTLRLKMKILFLKLSTVILVFLKATVEVFKRHLRELQQIKQKKRECVQGELGAGPQTVLCLSQSR